MLTDDIIDGSKNVYPSILQDTASKARITDTLLDGSYALSQTVYSTNYMSNLQRSTVFNVKISPAKMCNEMPKQAFRILTNTLLYLSRIPSYFTATEPITANRDYKAQQLIGGIQKKEYATKSVEDASYARPNEYATLSVSLQNWSILLLLELT